MIIENVYLIKHVLQMVLNIGMGLPVLVSLVLIRFAATLADCFDLYSFEYFL